MEFIKRKFDVGIGKESVRGTKVTPDFWIKPTAEDINDSVVNVVTERSMGVIEDSEDQVIVKKLSGGSIAGEIFDRSFGYLLLAAIGQVSSAETADSGVYDHTFTVLQEALHPTLTLEIKRGTVEQLAYANSVIENLKIMVEVNQYVTFEANFRGRVGVAATNEPSYVVENYFLAKGVVASVADAYDDLDTGTELDIKKISLEINKNIEDKDLLGNESPDFNNKQFAIEGSMQLNFTSVYEKNYVLDGTTKALRINIENGDVTIGATSNPTLTIDLAKVKFSEAPITGGNNDIAQIDVTFKGFYSASDALSIQAVLRNLKTSY